MDSTVSYPFLSLEIREISSEGRIKFLLGMGPFSIRISDRLLAFSFAKSCHFLRSALSIQLQVEYFLFAEKVMASSTLPLGLFIMRNCILLLFVSFSFLFINVYFVCITSMYNIYNNLIINNVIFDYLYFKFKYHY